MSASHLVLSYLRNMRAAHANGQSEHAAFLFEQAMVWLSQCDEEIVDGNTPLRFSIGIGMDTGTIRPRNEDYVFAEQAIRLLPNGVQETVGLFVVADGVGGHQHGQEAARLAVHTFVDFVFPRLLQEGSNVLGLKPLLIEGMRKANRVVVERSEEVSQRVGTMATTMTAVVSIGPEVYVANVGDSRAYLYRPGYGLQQLTQDHSVVATKVCNGEITPAEVFTHPERNVIYRSLGMKEVVIDAPDAVHLRDGDILLLCSDGLWEMVRDPLSAAIATILAKGSSSAEEMAEYLTQLALQGGGYDNVALVVVQCRMHIADCETVLLPPSQCWAEQTVGAFLR